MAFPGPKHAFPSAAEMADYLEAYTDRFELPVRLGTRVDRVGRDGGRYVVTAGEERFRADNVVVATGPYGTPSVPPFAARLDRRLLQLHSSEYRGPEQLQDGPVLVVGAAHSGSDIAWEVATAGQATILSGRPTGEIPVPIGSWRFRLALPLLRFVATRILTVRTPVGRKVRPLMRAHGGPLIRFKSADLAAAGVEWVQARTVGVEVGLPVLDGGRVLEVANVIWCTGFKTDWSWIDVPLEWEEDGYPKQYRGVVDSAPGLYFLGLKFLDSFSSSLVIGAGRDSAYVARHILRRASQRAGQAAAVEPDTVLSR